jgi:hypothetical protein
MLAMVAVIAIVLSCIVYRLQSGWTVRKVDALIATEFDPNWNWKQTWSWIMSHHLRPGFLQNPGSNLALNAPSLNSVHVEYPVTVKQSEVEYIIRFEILPEDGANIGWSKGRIYAEFFYGHDEKFLQYAISTSRYP